MHDSHYSLTSIEDNSAVVYPWEFFKAHLDEVFTVGRGLGRKERRGDGWDSNDWDGLVRITVIIS